MSDNTNETSALSIAVDKALLKLSREHGISLPKDDYILIQVYLNKAIIEHSFEDAIAKLALENKASRDYFRQALIKVSKAHNSALESSSELVKNSVEAQALAEKQYRLNINKVIIIFSIFTAVNIGITGLNFLGW